MLSIKAEVHSVSSILCFEN